MKLQSGHYKNVFTDLLGSDPRNKLCEPLFYSYYFSERGEISTCNLLYLLNTLKNLTLHYNAAISKTPDKAKLASHNYVFVASPESPRAIILLVATESSPECSATPAQHKHVLQCWNTIITSTILTQGTGSSRFRVDQLPVVSHVAYTVCCTWINSQAAGGRSPHRNFYEKFLYIYIYISAIGRNLVEYGSPVFLLPTIVFRFRRFLPTSTKPNPISTNIHVD